MQSYLEEDRHSLEYNWLYLAKSPYLKHYEKSLVNWLEWSEEAFEKASRDGKLVFLSIGSITKPLCQVELFNDEEIASLLNEKFISIKVDKVERPELATFYLHLCQAEIANADFPLCIFLTPKQLLLGTQPNIPNDRIGFVQLVMKVCEKHTKMHKQL